MRKQKVTNKHARLEVMEARTPRQPEKPASFETPKINQKIWDKLKDLSITIEDVRHIAYDLNNDSRNELATHYQHIIEIEQKIENLTKRLLVGE